VVLSPLQGAQEIVEALPEEQPGLHYPGGFATYRFTKIQAYQVTV
jgi:hypothetical protein